MLNSFYKIQNEKYTTISKSYGGYFRDDFIDHSYLYNMHFPPEAIFNKIKKNLIELAINYPVGHLELSRLLGEFIDQPSERIIVGNGASELIKILSSRIAKRLIIPVPTFNEYVNSAPVANVTEFPLEFPSFQLDVDKFAQEALKVNADVAVIVSPNNPTSISIPKRDIIRLSKKLEANGCFLIVDESFIDFSEIKEENTLEKEISQFINVAIIKSLSKCFGVCGLRLGYILTYNEKLANSIKKELPIWNINGFAEEFLRLVVNHKEEFIKSCSLVRMDRDNLYSKLCLIEGMSVYRPDANFVFCRLPSEALSGPEIARKLFVNHNIYIKHCQQKNLPDSDRYIRIACRTQNDNDVLVKSLIDVLE